MGTYVTSASKMYHGSGRGGKLLPRFQSGEMGTIAADRPSGLVACPSFGVDLRGALYDREQEEHLRRCGAILEDRCPP
jgi:hypothetical protein